MKQFKEGQEVGISVRLLHERNKPLTYGEVIHTQDEETNLNYYDLYNSDGELACMDGEEIIIDQVGSSLLTLKNNNGDSTIYFTLTLDEANYSIFS